MLVLDFFIRQNHAHKTSQYKIWLKIVTVHIFSTLLMTHHQPTVHQSVSQLLTTNTMPNGNVPQILTSQLMFDSLTHKRI